MSSTVKAQTPPFFWAKVSGLQENKVTIFNRWGDVVFNIDNYDNPSRVFRGLNNNGTELPSGTYYYRIDFTSGTPSKTGFIALRK